MSRSKRIAALLVAVLGLYTMMPSAAAPPPTAGVAAQSDAEPALAPSVAHTRAAPPPRPRAAADRPLPPPTHAPRAPDAVGAAPGALDVRRAELERSWGVELTDANWTDEVQRRLDAAIAEHGLGVDVKQVACRSTLCRVELLLADAGEGKKLHELELDADRRKEIFFATADDGASLAVTAYVFRNEQR